MKKLIKILVLVFVITLLGCSKKAETAEPLKAVANTKLNVASDKIVQPNIVNVPFDFKGVKIGMSKDEVKNIFPKLIKMKSVIGCSEETEFTCKDRLTLINEAPEVASFEFLNEKLDSLTIRYDNKIFKDLFYGLKEKYGEPKELDENKSKDSIEKRVESSTPVGVYWENKYGERIIIASIAGASVRGLSEGLYFLYSKQRVDALENGVESNKQREKLKRKDL